jgi:gluconolactonase
MKRSSLLFAVFCALSLGVVAVRAQTPAGTSSDREVFDPALNDIISPDARPELVKGGFLFTEGPVWVQHGDIGYLIFSDTGANKIMKLTPDGSASVYLSPAGYQGPLDGVMMLTVGSLMNNGLGKTNPLYHQFAMIGSDGLALDPRGRLVICNFGGRSVDRIEKNGKRVVLADSYEGKRFNGPNDVIVKNDGTIYFSDMWAGLRRGEKDPLKGLDYSALFMIKDGKVSRVTTDILETNGVALSPDQKYLYANTDRQDTINRYTIQPDDTLADSQQVVDISTPGNRHGNTDGLKVDSQGNIYSSGPGGLWIISPEGKPLGVIPFPEGAVNFTFGDADLKTLYMTSRTSVYKIRVKIPGSRIVGSFKVGH